jgi:hypothetical protein
VKLTKVSKHAKKQTQNVCFGVKKHFIPYIPFIPYIHNIQNRFYSVYSVNMWKLLCIIGSKFLRKIIILTRFLIKYLIMFTKRIALPPANICPTIFVDVSTINVITLFDKQTCTKQIRKFNWESLPKRC